MKKIEKLQQKVKELGLDVLLIPNNDEYFCEYIGEHAKRIEFISGFSGSYAFLIVCQDRLIFFTDSRYILQAKQQLSDSYHVCNIADKRPHQWIEENFTQCRIGYDPNVHLESNMKLYAKYDLVVLDVNPVDELWGVKRPTISMQKVFTYKYAGESSVSKCKKLFLDDDNAAYLLLTSPEDICWLLNIRAVGVVRNNPLVLGYALVSNDGQIKAFLHDFELNSADALEPNIELYNINEFREFLDAVSTIIVDRTAISVALAILIGSEKMIDCKSKLPLLRACKNREEIHGMKKSHILDGIAVTQFLFWLSNNDTSISEISARERLLEFRKESKEFVEPSFDTISSFNANGAIIHYSPTSETDLEITGNGIYLCDSGGQYNFGTTDITRTVMIGSATKEQKINFTLVLKGMIALSRAVFPMGTTGVQLDVLARQYLWEAGLDYKHGTGHGVGSFLGVHEGPQSISTRCNFQVSLKQGMVLSNEPGYYKDGEYGIRIENLMYVKEHGIHKGYLCFETLTCAPIDYNMIIFDLLSSEERSWLIDYHRSVLEKIGTSLSNDCISTLFDKFIS